MLSPSLTHSTPLPCLPAWSIAHSSFHSAHSLALTWVHDGELDHHPSISRSYPSITIIQYLYWLSLSLSCSSPLLYLLSSFIVIPVPLSHCSHSNFPSSLSLSLSFSLLTINSTQTQYSVTMSAQDKFRYYVSQIDKEVGVSLCLCLTLAVNLVQIADRAFVLALSLLSLLSLYATHFTHSLSHHLDIVIRPIPLSYSALFIHSPLPSSQSVFIIDCSSPNTPPWHV